MLVWREYNLVSIECLMRYYIHVFVYITTHGSWSAAQDPRSLTVLRLFFPLDCIWWLNQVKPFSSGATIHLGMMHSRMGNFPICQCLLICFIHHCRNSLLVGDGVVLFLYAAWTHTLRYNSLVGSLVSNIFCFCPRTWEDSNCQGGISRLKPLASLLVVNILKCLLAIFIVLIYRIYGAPHELWHGFEFCSIKCCPLETRIEYWIYSSWNPLVAAGGRI